MKIKRLISRLAAAGALFSLQLVLDAAPAEPGEWLELKPAIRQFGAGREALLNGLGLMEANPSAALAHFETARSEGNPVAAMMCALANPNAEERIGLLRQAHEARIKSAVYLLADALYRKGQAPESGWKEALTLFQQAAGWGNADASFFVGRMHHFGHAVEVDYVEARRVYQIAVDGGSAEAANNLSNLWADGLGGPVNLTRKVELLHFASDSGVAMASYNLGLYHLDDAPDAPNWKKAEPYFQTAWQQSEGTLSNAAYQLGRIAQFDYTGRGVDLAAAAAYYEVAAKTNDRAAFHLGRFYRDGLGVEPDTQKALSYFKRSTENNNPRAFFALARLYETGQFGVPDDATAIRYYEKAADLGHSMARANLAWLYWRHAPDAKQDAIHRLSRAAIAADNMTAISNYGYLNLFEKLDRSDPELGLRLTLQAAEAGERAAVENLVYYYDGFGDIREPDPKQAAFWRRKLAALDRR